MYNYYVEIQMQVSDYFLVFQGHYPGPIFAPNSLSKMTYS